VQVLQELRVFPVPEQRAQQVLQVLQVLQVPEREQVQPVPLQAADKAAHIRDC
jgi:hypothetical protein